MHRILERRGRTLDWWDSLSDDDQVEYLAYDHWKQRQLKQLRESMDDVKRFDKLAALVLVMLQELN